jgi:hypothetical protein
MIDSKYMQDIRDIDAREKSEDLDPDSVLELQIAAVLRDYTRKKMGDDSPCPACGCSCGRRTQ